jgi:hypothetical protein
LEVRNDLLWESIALDIDSATEKSSADSLLTETNLWAFCGLFETTIAANPDGWQIYVVGLAR